MVNSNTALNLVQHGKGDGSNAKSTLQGCTYEIGKREEQTEHTIVHAAMARGNVSRMVYMVYALLTGIFNGSRCAMVKGRADQHRQHDSLQCTSCNPASHVHLHKYYDLFLSGVVLFCNPITISCDDLRRDISTTVPPAPCWNRRSPSCLDSKEAVISCTPCVPSRGNGQRGSCDPSCGSLFRQVHPSPSGCLKACPSNRHQ